MKNFSEAQEAFNEKYLVPGAILSEMDEYVNGDINLDAVIEALNGFLASPDTHHRITIKSSQYILVDDKFGSYTSDKDEWYVQLTNVDGTLSAGITFTNYDEAEGNNELILHAKGCRYYARVTNYAHIGYDDVLDRILMLISNKVKDVEINS